MSAGNHLGCDHFLSAVHQDRRACAHLCRRHGYGLQVVAKVLEQRIRNYSRFAGWSESGDLHEPHRFLYRKRPQHYRVDQAENGRVGANSERQRQHRHHQETRASAQCSRGVVAILPEVFQPPTLHVAAILFELFQPAELQTGAAPRLSGIHARRHEIAHQAFEVVAQFLVQVRFRRLSSKPHSLPPIALLPGRAEDHSYGLR